MRPTEDAGGAFEYYVRKNYYKTGSLMANSCKASAVLGHHDLMVSLNDGLYCSMPFALCISCSG